MKLYRGTPLAIVHILDFDQLIGGYLSEFRVLLEAPVETVLLEVLVETTCSVILRGGATPSPWMLEVFGEANENLGRFLEALTNFQGDAIRL